MMRFSAVDIVFQEVPGEVALAYTITGCPVGCKGCHSADSWPAERGMELTDEHFEKQLNRYQGLVTAVLFLGGEWYPERLATLLRRAQLLGLQTCLYTGYEQVSAALMQHLTYLKTGPWRPECGGLDAPTTNQRYYDLRSGEVLNALFCPEFIDIKRKEEQHVALTT